MLEDLLKEVCRDAFHQYKQIKVANIAKYDLISSAELI